MGYGGGGGGLGGLVGAALGVATGGFGLELGAIAGGALGGGVGSAVTGGNPLQGAVLGGLGGYGWETLGAAGAAGAADFAPAAGAMSIPGTFGPMSTTAALAEAPLASFAPTMGAGLGVGAGAAAAADPWYKSLLSKLGTGLGNMSPSQMMTLGAGAYSLYGASQLPGMMNKLAMQSDPFGPYRAGYAQQLQALQADPSSITKMPGYTAGLEAVQRSMAAQGYTGSGNMMAALSKYGQDFYQQQFSNLSSLAGAGVNPAAGAQIAGQGMIGGMQSTMGGLALLGAGLKG